MNAEDRLNNAKKEISKIVSKLEMENNKELHDNLFENFCSHNSQDENISKNKESSNSKLSMIVFFSVLIVLFIISCVIASTEYKVPLFDNKSAQLFLAFVVALASYLANTARETVKMLSLNGGKDRIRYKKNIFLMAIAEIQLILIAVLTMCKITFEPGFILRNFQILNWISLLKNITLDSFLVSYLLVTIFWLVFIHSRIWWYTSPWDIYKSPSK